MNKPKLIITGYGQHGKDTVCEILNEEYGYTFKSSSHVALENAIWPTMFRYYESRDDCYKDRANWRPLWFRLIERYNTPDKARLAKDIFAASEIYCGMRLHTELEEACKLGLYEYLIWVNASRRVKPESSESITINESMCDFIIDNNGSIDDLVKNIDDIMRVLL